MKPLLVCALLAIALAGGVAAAVTFNATPALATCSGPNC